MDDSVYEAMYRRRSTIIQLQEPGLDEIQKAREERRTTGKIVAVIVALSLILLACYHAWIRKTAVLAGVIIPALIMVLYTAWVLYSAKRDKYRRNLNNPAEFFLGNLWGANRAQHQFPLSAMLQHVQQSNAALNMSEKGNADERDRKERRQRFRRKRRVVISQMYRNVYIQNIPPFNPAARQAEGRGNDVADQPHLEEFEYDSSIVDRDRPRRRSY